MITPTYEHTNFGIVLSTNAFIPEHNSLGNQTKPRKEPNDKNTDINNKSQKKDNSACVCEQQNKHSKPRNRTNLKMKRVHVCVCVCVCICVVILLVGMSLLCLPECMFIADPSRRMKKRNNPLPLEQEPSLFPKDRIGCGLERDRLGRCSTRLENFLPMDN